MKTEDKKEVGKILTEAAHIKNMLKSDGWMCAKQRLFDKISDLSNILAIEEKDPHRFMIEVVANQQALKILLDWLNDLEGEVKRGDYYAEQFKDINQKADVIKYYN